MAPPRLSTRHLDGPLVAAFVQIYKRNHQNHRRHDYDQCDVNIEHCHAYTSPQFFFCDGAPALFYSALTQARPDWLKEGKARIILQFGPERLKELPDVPFGLDLMRNEDDKLLMQASSAPQALGRPFLLPPGVPSDRVAAMRKAFADTFTDPEFRDDAEKIGLIVNAPRTGEQLQKVITDAYETPQRVVDRLRSLYNPQ